MTVILLQDQLMKIMRTIDLENIAAKCHDNRRVHEDWFVTDDVYIHHWLAEAN